MANFFENRVLNAVGPVLNTGERAEFFNGTLFVEVGNIDRARKVEQVIKAGGFGDMIVNWTGSEYIVDFI